MLTRVRLVYDYTTGQNLENRIQFVNIRLLTGAEMNHLKVGQIFYSASGSKYAYNSSYFGAFTAGIHDNLYGIETQELDTDDDGSLENLEWN